MFSKLRIQVGVMLLLLVGLQKPHLTVTSAVSHMLASHGRGTNRDVEPAVNSKFFAAKLSPLSPRSTCLLLPLAILHSALSLSAALSLRLPSELNSQACAFDDPPARVARPGRLIVDDRFSLRKTGQKPAGGSMLHPPGAQPIPQVGIRERFQFPACGSPNKQPLSQPMTSFLSLSTHKLE
jgi:hypothetical protein